MSESRARPTASEMALAKGYEFETLEVTWASEGVLSVRSLLPRPEPLAPRAPPPIIALTFSLSCPASVDLRRDHIHTLQSA